MKANDKILCFLGLAKKAGKVCFGRDAVMESILKNKTTLVLLASDLSEKSAKDIKQVVIKNHIDYIISNITMDEFSSYLGKTTGIIGVNDKNFAKKLTELAKQY